MKITASESIRNACFDLERLSRMNFAFGETEVRGGGGLQKNFFRLLGPQFGLKIKKWAEMRIFRLLSLVQLQLRSASESIQPV